MLRREAALALGEPRCSDRRDQTPMAADWAVLSSPPAEPQRLDGSDGNPDRREEVTLAAPDHEIAAEPTAAHPSADALDENRAHGGYQKATSGKRHV